MTVKGGELVQHVDEEFDETGLRLEQPWINAEWLTEQDILDRKEKFEPGGWPMRPSLEKPSTENDTVQPQASINTLPNAETFDPTPVSDGVTSNEGAPNMSSIGGDVGRNMEASRNLNKDFDSEQPSLRRGRRRRCPP